MTERDKLTVKIIKKFVNPRTNADGYIFYKNALLMAEDIAEYILRREGEDVITEKLFQIVKSSWSLKIFLAGKYIQTPIDLHSDDIDAVLDQIYAEETWL